MKNKIIYKFVAALTALGMTAGAHSADLNADGSIDADDAYYLIEQLQSSPGSALSVLDIDGDGAFTLSDGYQAALIGDPALLEPLRDFFGNGSDPALPATALFVAGNGLVDILQYLAVGNGYAAAVTASSIYLQLGESVFGAGSPASESLNTAASIQVAALDALDGLLSDLNTAPLPPSVFGPVSTFLDSLGITSTAGLNNSDFYWVNYPNTFVPVPDLNYNQGTLSGPYPLSMNYHDGLYTMGDGNGGLWWSDNSVLWTKADVFVGNQARSLQNAPVRSITRSANGTYIASTLGGGGVSEVGALTGATEKGRTPFLRSLDGKTWQAHNPPTPNCGMHYTATDGAGTWIAAACGSELLVSYDDGVTWVFKPTGLSQNALRGMGYFNGMWFITAGSGAPGINQGGIYSSTDLGSWTLRSGFPVRPPGNGSVIAKKFVTTNGKLIMLGTYHTVMGSNDGVTWSVMQTSPTGLPYDASAILQGGRWHPKFGYMFGGTMNVVDYSADGINWTTDTRYYGISEVHEIVLNESCETTLIGMEQSTLGLRKLVQLKCDLLRLRCKPVVVNSCN